MKLFERFLKHDKNKEQIKKNTVIYGVLKEVLYEGKITAIDFLMLNPFKTKQYMFPCFFVKEEDAMALRNAYTNIKSDGERYTVFAETYNNIFGNGQSPFKIENPQLYHSYNEFVAERKNEIQNNTSNNNTL
ncbi:MAG: hypothetical protein J6Q13_04145 [Clostridia bacterium]|nr:hypothetical protein [Clostridia bacterium]